MPTPQTGENWGILGGTFDPVHLGHISLASEIMSRKNLTGVLFVPSFKHPFKTDRCRASFDERLAMLRLALLEDDRFRMCEIERSQNLSGRTIDTVRAIKREYPDTRFSFLIGADNLNDLPRWYAVGELLREIKVLAGSRPGAELTFDAAKYGMGDEAIEFIPGKLVNVSSTNVRERLGVSSDDSELATMIPQPVLQYIRKTGLYE